MNEQREYVYCLEHVPDVTPDGFRRQINFQHRKCERCEEIADVVIYPTPLEYPKLRYA